MKTKKSLRETLEANQKALEGLCRMAGKPAPAPAITMAPKRERKPSQSTVPTEHQEQVAFVKWFRMQYPKVRIFAVPNAAARTPQLAAYLKAEGLTAGVQDLWIPEWRVCIEMKRIKGWVISAEQRDWAEYMTSIGWTHIFGRGFEDAKLAVLMLDVAYNVPHEGPSGGQVE